MKYCLMRAYWCNMRNSFVLDLYNPTTQKCVELHYYNGYKTYDIDKVAHLLDYYIKYHEMYDLNFWDNLIKKKR